MNTLKELEELIQSDAGALRQVVKMLPAGGPATKVMPAQYADGTYAFETRHIPNEGEVRCVLLDSTAAQANRMEMALLNAVKSGLVFIPHIQVSLGALSTPDRSTLTDMECPSRFADAIIRDSIDLNGARFRDSEVGRLLAKASRANATPLLRYSPVSLLFGAWDGFGNLSGARFQRLIASEVIGIAPLQGVRTSSRVDPLGIEDNNETRPIYKKGNDWTLDESEADKDDKARPIKVGKANNKPGRPSQIGHGNVLPAVDEKQGGVSIRYALWNCTFSLGALRHLQFPLDDTRSPELDLAGQSALLALGLLAVSLVGQKGLWLRSGCDLVAEHPTRWEIVRPGTSTYESFHLTPEQAIALFSQSKARLSELGMPMNDAPVVLALMDKVVALAQK